MGPQRVVAGSTNVSVVIRIMDSTTGLPETGLAFSQAGLSLSYWRVGASSTTVICQAAGTPGSNITLGAAHTDGGFEEIGNGHYRLDVQDAAFAAGVDGVLIFGTVTGMVVYAEYIELADPVNGLFESFVIGGTGNSTTALHLSTLTGYADDELIDELLWVYDDSAAEWHPAWITDWVLSTLVATVVSARSGGALPFTPEDSTDRVWRSGVSRGGIVTAGLGANLTPASVIGAVGSVTALADVPLGIITGTAATGTLSTTQCTSDLSGYADDELIGRTITFTGGTAEGQQSRITDYASASGLVTFATITTAPANADTFKIT